MVDMLHNAVGWLDGMRESWLSQTVSYWRGNDSVQLAATLGTTRYDVMDEAGATIKAKATDFIVASASLVLAGVVSLPLVGDVIRLASNGTIAVFQVLELGAAGHYQPCDPGGTMLRIHAKQIDEEEG